MISQRCGPVEQRGDHLGFADEDLDALLRDPDQMEGGAVEGE